MKIKITPEKYEKVVAKQPAKRPTPIKPNIVIRTLAKIISIPVLKMAKFKCTRIGMEELEDTEPCLYLVNSSSSIDAHIAASVLYPKPYNVITSPESLVGRSLLMRMLGFIPAKKFIADIDAAKDASYAMRKLGSSVVLFPECVRTLDGKSSALPENLGRFIKTLGASVAVIHTYGAYLRQPSYSAQRRRVPVSADVKFMLSRAEVKSKTAEQINELIRAEFDSDSYRWQQENGIRICEPFRADCLNRLLYKCPHCQSEGKTVGKDTSITCTACGAVYELNEDGMLCAADGDTRFRHIPDWVEWQRSCVRAELEDKSYSFCAPVSICMSIDTKNLYYVGKGHLTHTSEGFHLISDDQKLDIHQKPSSAQGLYAEFNWRGVGDLICVGNSKALYYCLPDTDDELITKLRLATEENYKISKK